MKAAWAKANPELAAKLELFFSGKAPKVDWSAIEQKAGSATRAASATVLGALATQVENMIVASADLSNSDKTDGFLKKTHSFKKGDFSGAFFQAGVRDMRLDVFDVLVGINLLREGLDIPEIQLVAILDADKEGFLRSATSLIQTIGRAARNAKGHVVMYADDMTDSMNVAITETNRRRKIQQAYNEEHGITPQTIQKAVRDLISISKTIAKEEQRFEKDPESMSREELEKLVKEVEKQMKRAAADLNFEAAAELRDRMVELKTKLRDFKAVPSFAAIFGK